MGLTLGKHRALAPRNLTTVRVTNSILSTSQTGFLDKPEHPEGQNSHPDLPSWSQIQQCLGRALPAQAESQARPCTVVGVGTLVGCLSHSLTGERSWRDTPQSREDTAVRKRGVWADNRPFCYGGQQSQDVHSWVTSTISHQEPHIRPGASYPCRQKCRQTLGTILRSRRLL